jgi:hypothetical protein
VSCSTPIPSFTSNISGSSAFVPRKTSGTTTLKTIWKLVEKQQVDDTIVELFYACAIPFDVARCLYYQNALKMAVEFGKGYVPPEPRL